MQRDTKVMPRSWLYRRNWWVDTKFQVTWVAGVVGLAATLLIVLGGLYLNTLSEQRRLMGVNRLAQATQAVEVAEAMDDAEFDRDLQARLEEEDARSTLWLALSAALLVVMLAAIAVRLTFHVAGPARAVSTMLKHLAEGDPDPVRHLRKGDQFRFLGEDMRRLNEALSRRREADAALMREAAQALEAGTGPAPDLARRLRERVEETA